MDPSLGFTHWGRENSPNESYEWCANLFDFTFYNFQITTTSHKDLTMQLLNRGGDMNDQRNKSSC